MIRSMLLAALVVASLAGCTAAPVQHHAASHPIAECSLWASTEFPVLPSHTRTDVCVADDGTLSFAPKVSSVDCNVAPPLRCVSPLDRWAPEPTLQLPTL